MENTAPNRRNSRYCCVVKCHNSEANTKGKLPLVKFYSFPGKWYETDRRDAWIRAVRRTKWANRSRSAACNPTPPPPLEQSSPEASELPESEGSPDSNVGQEALELDLLLLADVAWDVQPLPLTAEMETQTDTANSKGPLQLMLSATDGACGSTQAHYSMTPPSGLLLASQISNTRAAQSLTFGPRPYVLPANLTATQPQEPAVPRVHSSDPQLEKIMTSLQTVQDRLRGIEGKLARGPRHGHQEQCGSMTDDHSARTAEKEGISHRQCYTRANEIRVIEKLLLNLEIKRETKTDVYMAIEMVAESWRATRSSIVVNCFRHAGFHTSTSEAASDSTSLQHEQEEASPSCWEELRRRDQVAADESFDDFVNAAHEAHEGAEDALTSLASYENDDRSPRRPVNHRKSLVLDQRQVPDLHLRRTCLLLHRSLKRPHLKSSRTSQVHSVILRVKSSTVLRVTDYTVHRIIRGVKRSKDHHQSPWLQSNYRSPIWQFAQTHGQNCSFCRRQKRVHLWSLRERVRHLCLHLRIQWKNSRPSSTHHPRSPSHLQLLYHQRGKVGQYAREDFR
ncbi:hypothetical protein HPB47_015911 [Ixodes persulcatus]|uniref:Uncharacterized protein n=1 Tax=Ixodes persulcatus TaxID=34615 RepID=A0AC60QS89_IXOPE|nr:hypothetical protein HPB47_015911 [Ixodes persulcatus]